MPAVRRAFQPAKKVLSSIFAHKSLAEFLDKLRNFAARRRRNNLYFSENFRCVSCHMAPQIDAAGQTGNVGGVGVDGHGQRGLCGHDAELSAVRTDDTQFFVPDFLVELMI